MTNKEERDWITQLRCRLEGTDMHELGDHTLWAFTKATNGDLDQAEKLLIKFIEVRSKIMNERLMTFDDYVPLEIIAKAAPNKILGTTLDGNPVIWAALGQLNLRELLNGGHKYEVFKFIAQLCENLCEEIYKQSCLVGKFVPGVLMVDMKNLSITKFLHMEMIQLIRSAKEFEPLFSLIDAMYIVNSSWTYYYLLNIIKPLIPKSAIGKMEVLDSNIKNWKGVLQANFSMDIIPREYGGKGEKVFM